MKSAATNEKAWQTSESDVKRAGESSSLRDFHSLNYLEYAYLQLGRYRDARRTLDVIAAQYDALTDKKTAADHSRPTSAARARADHLCDTGPRGLRVL